MYFTTLFFLVLNKIVGFVGLVARTGCFFVFFGANRKNFRGIFLFFVLWAAEGAFRREAGLLLGGTKNFGRCKKNFGRCKKNLGGRLGGSWAVGKNFGRRLGRSWAEIRREVGHKEPKWAKVGQSEQIGELANWQIANWPTWAVAKTCQHQNSANVRVAIPVVRGVPVDYSLNAQHYVARLPCSVVVGLR